MSIYDKPTLPEGWEIIPDLHNGYRYKGIRVLRIDRQEGNGRNAANYKDSDKTFGEIGLGVFKTMKKMALRIEQEYDL